MKPIGSLPVLTTEVIGIGKRLGHYFSLPKKWFGSPKVTVSYSSMAKGPIFLSISLSVSALGCSGLLAGKILKKC